ncbi:MAG: chromosome partitioning protein ParB [Methylobacter sp.]|nr:MAG: chromosome partitioning protein ParB [Methylobacter sp.]
MSANNALQTTNSSGLLDGMGDLSALLNTPEAANNGSPLELNLNLIDEDPDQPRMDGNPGFSNESLKELTDSIKLRGVKTPISVRDNLNIPGRYIINHGARRYRASIRADKETIPGFIDNDYNHADQVVENLQRNDLTPREIANFIGRELAAGRKKTEIAKSISKSPAYITQHVVLLDLPDPIAQVFNNGRVKDVTVINELVKLHKKDAEKVGEWLSDESLEITRGSVEELKEYIIVSALGTEHSQSTVSTDSLADGNDKTQLTDLSASNPIQESYSETSEFSDETVDKLSQGETDIQSKQPEEPTGKQVDKKSEKQADPSKFKKTIVQIWHDGRPARIMLDRRPTAEGFGHIKYDDDRREIEVDLGEVKLIALLEG